MQGYGLAFFILFAYGFRVCDAIDGEVNAFFRKTDGDIGDIFFSRKEHGGEICFARGCRKRENGRGIMFNISWR